MDVSQKASFLARKVSTAYVRTLLMHGARAIIARSKHTIWITGLLARRPYSVVVAALANKLARTAWAPDFDRSRGALLANVIRASRKNACTNRPYIRLQPR